MNEDLIKEKICNYFSQKKYQNRQIPKEHFAIIQFLEKNFSISIEEDQDCDYGHSTNLLIILNQQFGITAGNYDYLINHEKDILKQTINHKHFGIYFKLSLIDNIACYIINSREIIDGRIDVEDCSEKELPKEMLEQLSSILNSFSENNWMIKSFDFFENQKRNWLNSIFSFENYDTSLADMLFGSVDFYSSIDI